MSFLSDCEVVVISQENRREIKRFRSGKDGRYEINLSPGRYILYPNSTYDGSWVVIETEFTVQPGKIIEVNARYDALW